MQASYTDLLSDILTVINYSDREKFVREFEQMNKLEAIENSVKKFPKHVYDSIMTHGSTPEEVMKLLNPTSYKEELLKVSAEALADFIQHMKPVLTFEQKEKISVILQNAQRIENIL